MYSVPGDVRSSSESSLSGCVLDNPPWTELILVCDTFQASYCYAMSFIPGTMLSAGGNTGNILYDVRTQYLGVEEVPDPCLPYLFVQWFIGRNLNPRIGLFDIKTFKCVCHQTCYYSAGLPYPCLRRSVSFDLV